MVVWRCKTYGVLCQISGFKNIEALLIKFPGKFEANIVKKFIGADIKGDCKNLKAILLEKYYHDVTTLGMGSEDIPVKFNEVESLEDAVVISAIDSSDAVFLHMQEANSELCVSIIQKVMHSDKMVHVGVLIYQNELQCFQKINICILVMNKVQARDALPDKKEVFMISMMRVQPVHLKLLLVAGS